MPLPKWGGVSLFVCSPHSKLASILSSFPTPFPAFIVANFQTNRAKRGKSEFFFGGRLCFLGKIGDSNGQKPNIFLKCGCKWCMLCRLFGVSTGAGFRGCRTCQNVGFVLLSCVPLFLSALSLCYWCVACKYGSISRFYGVFSEVWGCCVGLCGSGALRGLWGFVRVNS